MPPHHVLILATSLSANSRSRALARHLHEQLLGRRIETTFVDLRDLPLPLCGSPAAWTDPNVARLKEAIAKATHVVFATPVYNFDVNAAAKNVAEHASQTLEGKTVAFLCAAGGQRSYMSVMPFANSLMLDFRCWIVPRFVYVTKQDFTGDTITNPEITERVERLIDDMFA